MNDPDTTELIKQAAAGDAMAFESLVNTYYTLIYKCAYRWCGNQQNAEDITQEACIRLARGISSYKHESAFTSWLYRLTLNAAKDWQRSANRHTSASADAIDITAASDNQEDQLYMRQVLAAVQTLPEGEKDAVLLVCAEGLSHGEAALICGCKESTISWRIHEARKKLGMIFNGDIRHG